jgi:malate dehydrogenase
MQGEDKIYECTFVQTDVVEGCDFFATKCRLGPDGVAEILPLPDLTDFEAKQLEVVKEELQKNISKGKEFAQERAKK